MFAASCHHFWWLSTAQFFQSQKRWSHATVETLKTINQLTYPTYPIVLPLFSYDFPVALQVRVDWFMRGSAILLMFIAAGFFSASMHQLQELDVFGIWSPRAERPWQNQQVWDARECCNDKTNRFFVLMRALFGWQASWIFPQHLATLRGSYGKC